VRGGYKRVARTENRGRLLAARQEESSHRGGKKKHKGHGCATGKHVSGT